MNSGKTVFTQIMKLIPRRDFNEIVARHKDDYRVRNLSCHVQFLVMCMAQYADKNSLCVIEASLNALAVVRKLYHCGISYAVPRNTLAKANENRDWHIYAELGEVLIKKVRPLYAKDKFRLDIDNMVYAFNSTTISLCLKLCPWAKLRKNKGGIKMHKQIDLRGNLPVFIHLTRASVHDVNAMDEICIEMGAIYLMDKGYVDFSYIFAAYVNEDNPVIDAFLKEVLAYNPGLTGFTGYLSGNPNDVHPQVSTIFATLRRMGVKYSNITTTSNTNQLIWKQYVRFSDEVLNNTQANCMDGTAFFCSCLRKIGIHSVMVFKPGHVYLGYYSNPNRTQFYLLETTYVGTSKTIWEAWNDNISDFNAYHNLFNNSDVSDQYFMIDIDAARNFIKPIGR
ncbi:MAG: DUF4372 domain-containing protein [Dysgonamonadaceae bacterium]|nr:DUF4372 domain-containing protein [Dysgonamonadaceae bacterium]